MGNKSSNQKQQQPAPAPKPTPTPAAPEATVVATETQVEDVVVANDNTVTEVSQELPPVVEAVSAPAPVVEPTPEVVVAPVATAPVIQNDPFELPLSASPASRLLIAELKEYIAKMSAKFRMPAQEGGQIQALLYHILIQAVNTKAEEFDMVFGLVMKLIRANLDGAFSDAVVHRYTPHVVLPAAQAASLRYLVNALTALADPSPATRAAAKRQTNIEQALNARQIKEDARQRVLAFFNYQ